MPFSDFQQYSIREGYMWVGVKRKILGETIHPPVFLQAWNPWNSSTWSKYYTFHQIPNGTNLYYEWTIILSIFWYVTRPPRTISLGGKGEGGRFAEEEVQRHCFQHLPIKSNHGLIHAKYTNHHQERTILSLWRRGKKLPNHKRNTNFKYLGIYRAKMM